MYYTNKELARAWFRTVTQSHTTAGKLKQYSTRMAEIARCPVNLSDYYQKHGTLEGVIRGMGRAILEELIARGEDVVKEEVAARKTTALRKAQDERMKMLAMGARRQEGDDVGNLWDNTVRSIEDRS